MDSYINRRYKKCAICGTRRLPKSNIFLSNFPLDPERCRLWVKASGDEDLINVPIEKLHQLKFVCGLHFTRDCFNEKGNRLLKHAVPTLALPPPLADDLFTEFPLHVCSYYGKIEEQNRDASLPKNTEEPNTSAVEFMPVASTSKASMPLTYIKKTDEPPIIVGSSTSSMEYVPVASTSKDPMHLTYKRRSDESPTTIEPSTKSMEYVPVASTSKDPMHLTYKRRSDEVANQDVVVVQSYKRQKSVDDKHDAVHHNMTKREKKLLKRLEESKTKLKTLLRTSLNLDNLDSDTLKTIVNNAVKNQKRQPHGKRWDIKNKISALAIFKRSPKAYRYMQNVLLLPSVRTLQRILKDIPVEPGVHSQIINLLKNKSEKLDSNEKHCVLLFDEMALKKRLIYNESCDKIEGFLDLGGDGDMGRQNKIAGHALVFMLQGLKIKFKQPISHYFVEGTIETNKLSVLIKKNIEIVKEAGFTIIATVCDQGPTNIGALNFLKKCSSLPVDQNYFYCNNNKIYIIYDLFKSIRNNFYQAGIMEFNGKTAKWSHLVEAENKNKNFLNFPKITQIVVNPTFKIKMKVKYAAYALSNTMKAVLKTMAIGWDKDRAEELFETAQVIEELDKLFDVTNGPASPNDRKPGIRENVSKKTKHIELWNYYLKHIDTMKFFKSDSKLQLKNIRCIKCYKITLKSFKDIWNCLSKEEYKFLNLRQLNQDALENLFGTIRQHSATNRNPTCSHFNAALKSSIVSGLTGPHSRGSNCLEDANKLLITYKEILKPKQPILENLLEQTGSHDNCPVLSIPEEPDIEDLETNLSNFEEQSTVYVSGYLAAKIIKKMNCDSCKSSLIEISPDPSELMYRYIHFKEWWPDKSSLHYPKKELCTMLAAAKRIYEEEITPYLHNVNIAQWCCLQLSTKLNMNWYNCAAHSENIKDFLFMFISKLFIRKSCKIINESFSNSENDVADKIKKAQQANKDK